MMITAVPREALGIVWGDVVRVLDKSVKTSKGKFTVEDVLLDIQKGEYALWLIIEEKEVRTHLLLAPFGF